MNILSYIALFLTLTLAQAQNAVLFEQGNSLYNDGKYAEAIAQYETILESGEHSAELYFNLGNAYYKLNDIAHSIYFYEKALQLAPNDTEIQNNLGYAQQMTVDAINVVPEVGFSKLYKNVVNTFSFDGWAKWAVLFMVLFVLGFLLYYFSENTAKKRLAFVGFLVCLGLSVATLSLAFQKHGFDKKDKPAVVFAQETSVKNDPKLSSSELFKLHEGTKVQILETFEGWNKIQLTDGQTGWVEKDAVRQL